MRLLIRGGGRAERPPHFRLVYQERKPGLTRPFLMPPSTRNRKHVCGICLSEGADLFTNGCTPRGRHFFCESCISSWIDEGHNTCPTCKAEFDQLVTAQNCVMRRGVKRKAPDDARSLEGVDEDTITEVEREVIRMVMRTLSGLQGDRGSVRVSFVRRYEA